jgi:hypothetical protein
MMRPVFRYPYILPTGNLSLSAAENDVLLFPNPATDVIQIKSSESDLFNWSIWDVSGKSVKTGVTFSNEPISVNDLPKGMYFMRVMSKRGLPQTIRFIKTN